MTAFRTCHTCAKPAATCPTRATLQSALAGLSITSLKHRCRDFVPAFLPGEAVKVQTLAWYHRDDDDPPPRCWFPGHFIRLVGPKALVFVAAKATALDADVEFEPQGHGYLKVPLKRVAVRDGAPADIQACRWCAAILGVGDLCGRDPHYTPARDCLAETLRAKAAQDGSDTREASKPEGHGRPNTNGDPS